MGVRKDILPETRANIEKLLGDDAFMARVVEAQRNSSLPPRLQELDDAITRSETIAEKDLSLVVFCSG